MIAVYDRLDERVSEIRVLEHEGDEIDNEVEARLDRAFITPFDREDIHDLVSRIDDVLDGIQEVAETFVIYDVKKPTNDARRLAGILAAQALQLSEAIAKLESLKGIEPHVRQIHELENEADGLSRAAVARLFRDGIEAIEVIKWRDVYTRPREHDRRRGGRGRGHRADRRQERLTAPGAAGAASATACGRSSSRPRSAASRGARAGRRRWSR